MLLERMSLLFCVVQGGEKSFLTLTYLKGILSPEADTCSTSREACMVVWAAITLNAAILATVQANDW